MDYSHDFLTKWKCQFEDNRPPDDLLVTLQNVKSSSLQLALKEAADKLDATERLASQQRFVFEFLEDLSTKVSEEYNDLNNGQKTGSEGINDGLSSPDSDLYAQKPLKPKPTPRARTSVATKDRNSMAYPQPNQSDDQPVLSRKSGSLDSKAKRQHEKTAAPPPPKKPPSIRQVLRREVDREEELEHIAQSNLAQKRRTVFEPKLHRYEEIEINPDSDYDNPTLFNVVPRDEHSLGHSNSTSSGGGHAMHDASPGGSHSMQDESPGGGHSMQDASSSENLYDEPIPIDQHTDDGGDSSSDEEPMYLNLRQYKQTYHHLTMYGSLDFHKLKEDKLARAVKKFSIRCSYHPQGAAYTSPPPGKKLSDSIHLDGVTEESSATDEQRSRDEGDLDQSNSQVESSLLRGNSSNSEDNLSQFSTDLDMGVQEPYAESQKVQMRQWVVKGILDSERNYVANLAVLQQYMNSFRAASSTKEMVIPAEDIAVIFSNIPDLHKIHVTLIQDLEPRVESWSTETQVADAFKEMIVQEIPLASDYIKNYQHAISTVHRCLQLPRFAELVGKIKVVGIQEVLTLEELLHKPVIRLQRNTLVLHDLINCTPVSHADYDILQKTLRIAQEFLDTFETPKPELQTAESQRYLAKYNPTVQKISQQRKLRHLFLFNDTIICAKQRISGNKRIHYEPKWWISLLDLTLDDKLDGQEDDMMAENHMLNIEEIQRQIVQVQSQLKEEMKKLRGGKEKSNSLGLSSWSIRGHNKNIERLKKKLVQHEGQLVVEAPYLVFRLKNGRTNKFFTLLMSSDYERNNWKETIIGLKGKVREATNLGTNDVETLLNSIKLPKAFKLVDEEDDSWLFEEERLFGALAVTIHKLEGAKASIEAYCCLELDSFSHFVIKAKTNISKHSFEPLWNENFELDLEGSQTLRILVYKVQGKTETVLCRGALQLSKAWLRGEFQEKNISVNDGMSVVLSLRYITRDQTISRCIASPKGGVFGVSLATVTKQECTNIPLIVKVCTDEIEKRGLREEGIYRVSGLSSTIQELKKGFNKNSRQVARQLYDVDVNVISSLLKLYFRELPEALFTDSLYLSLENGVAMSDPEAKEKLMCSLVKSLPQPNYCTAVLLLNHLLKISEFSDSNKMTLNNLATVFGPTLLRPAAKRDSTSPVTMEMFKENAREAMMQSAILYYLLQVHQRGALQ